MLTYYSHHGSTVLKLRPLNADTLLVGLAAAASGCLLGSWFSVAALVSRLLALKSLFGPQCAAPSLRLMFGSAALRLLHALLRSRLNISSL